LSIAIACASGSFRGAFVHGVLSAFEKEGFRAGAYAAASSSVIPAAYAVLGQLKQLGGADYWRPGVTDSGELEYGASEMVLLMIAKYGPFLHGGLFEPERPRLVIATSAVTTAEAAGQTQGDGARQLGRRLLLATRRRDRSWADQHLALHLFGTLDSDGVLPLTADNLEDVIYASTRMLHAWRIPASIDGRPYVDASYTCSCPAVEMAELGYDQVIAIVPEPGPAYRDFFQSEPIPSSWQDVPIHLIQPDVSLGKLGVDYTTATPDGFDAVYRHGKEEGSEFVKWFRGWAYQIAAGPVGEAARVR
jgi:hypothetical protein